MKRTLETLAGLAGTAAVFVAVPIMLGTGALLLCGYGAAVAVQERVQRKKGRG